MAKKKKDREIFIERKTSPGKITTDSNSEVIRVQAPDPWPDPPPKNEEKKSKKSDE